MPISTFNQSYSKMKIIIENVVHHKNFSFLFLCDFIKSKTYF